jgi:hypothetical protein
MILEGLDYVGMLNVAISVTIGSVVATVIVWLLINHFLKRAVYSVMLDRKVETTVKTFIENNIVAAFNGMNNAELKGLITETVERSLELAIKKLKEKEEKED